MQRINIYLGFLKFVNLENVFSRASREQQWDVQRTEVLMTKLNMAYEKECVYRNIEYNGQLR